MIETAALSECLLSAREAGDGTKETFAEIRNHDIYLLSGREGCAVPTDNLPALLKVVDSERKHRTILAGSLSIADVVEMVPKHEDTLLGNRWLCRKGACLMPAPSGVGKSVLSMQMIISWSLGRPCIGIAPSHPLRILLVQAENDDGDTCETVKGIIRGMDLHQDAVASAGTRTCLIEKRDDTGRDFVAWLDPVAGEFKPDLIVIDPLQAYLGADPTDTERVAAFCRNGLNPLLERHNCGLLLVHHTPKTNHRDTSNWKPGDWAYAAAGCADLTNWARAILVLDPVGADRTTFKLIAAKRGGRIGWHSYDGRPVYEKFLSHAQHGIHWMEVDEPASARLPTKADLLDLVPDGEIGIEKNALLSLAQGQIAGLNKCRGWIAELLHDGDLAELKIDRPGTRPAMHLARCSRP